MALERLKTAARDLKQHTQLEEKQTCDVRSEQVLAGETRAPVALADLLRYVRAQGPRRRELEGVVLFLEAVHRCVSLPRVHSG